MKFGLLLFLLLLAGCGRNQNQYIRMTPSVTANLNANSLRPTAPESLSTVPYFQNVSITTKTSSTKPAIDILMNYPNDRFTETYRFHYKLSVFKLIEVLKKAEVDFRIGVIQNTTAHT